MANADAGTDPKVATQGQWEDLVSRVKSGGGSTIELTNTDPGEGSTLAEGKFIGVYGDAGQVQTADIANSAVTSDKIDWATLGFKQASILLSPWKSLLPAETTYASLTIETSGTYMLFASTYIENNSTDGSTAYIYVGSELVKCSTTTVTGYQTLIVVDCFDITAGTTVYLKASSSKGRILVTSTRTGLHAFRVA